MTLLFLLIQALLLDSTTAESSCKAANYVYYEGWCYRYDSTLIEDYDQAVKACKAAGDVLVSIHDAFMNSYVQSFNLNGVLIGYRYHADFDRYEWADGSRIDYTNYADDFVTNRDQNGYCTKLYNRRWTSVHCDTGKLPFVCMHEAVPQTSPAQCLEVNQFTTPGTIYSPGYPEFYNIPTEYSNCEILLGTLTYPYVRLEFDEVDFSENGASIYVYKGWDATAEIVQATNDFSEKSLIVASYMVKLKMMGTTKGRWKITWVGESKDETVTSKTVCPDSTLIYYPPVTIKSPGYPDTYSLTTGFECEYMIAARKGYEIEIYWQETTASHWCCYDAFLNWELLQNHEVTFYFDTSTQGKYFNFSTDRLGIMPHDLASGRYNLQFTEIKVGK